MRKSRGDEIGKGISAAAPQNGTGGKQRPKAADAEAGGGGGEADPGRRRRQEGHEKPEGNAGEGEAGIRGRQPASAGIKIHRPHRAQEEGDNHQPGKDQCDHPDPQQPIRQSDPLEHGQETETEGEGGKCEAESAVDPGAVDLGVRDIVPGHIEIQWLMARLQGPTSGWKISALLLIDQKITAAAARQSIGRCRRADKKRYRHR